VSAKPCCGLDSNKQASLGCRPPWVYLQERSASTSQKIWASRRCMRSSTGNGRTAIRLFLIVRDLETTRLISWSRELYLLTSSIYEMILVS
ncbi:hypothetical protein J6590_094414, partial [Homalodisca vitripennis]